MNYYMLSQYGNPGEIRIDLTPAGKIRFARGFIQAETAIKETIKKYMWLEKAFKKHVHPSFTGTLRVGGDTCALCNYIHQIKGYCPLCPIGRAVKLSYCLGTPWIRFRVPASYSVLLQIIREEIKFLKGIQEEMKNEL